MGVANKARLAELQARHGSRWQVWAIDTTHEAPHWAARRWGGMAAECSVRSPEHLDTWINKGRLAAVVSTPELACTLSDDDIRLLLPVITDQKTRDAVVRGKLDWVTRMVRELDRDPDAAAGLCSELIRDLQPHVAEGAQGKLARVLERHEASRNKQGTVPGLQHRPLTGGVPAGELPRRQPAAPGLVPQGSVRG